MPKYEIYATKENGDGHVSCIGILDTDELEEFQIRVGMFADDVVITLAEVREEEK